MKRCLLYGTMIVALLGLTLGASARDGRPARRYSSAMHPQRTKLLLGLGRCRGSRSLSSARSKCICRRQAFPRGSYLVGHLEASKEPGHFFGKGYLKLQFDRIGLPSGDLPLEAKVIATRGYRVDREGKIDGKGHAKRDIVEWLLPTVWPWKVIMLPARGPRPKLKGESTLSLRLMDDVQIPQVATTYGPEWRFFWQAGESAVPRLSVRQRRSNPRCGRFGNRGADCRRCSPCIVRDCGVARCGCTAAPGHFAGACLYLS